MTRERPAPQPEGGDVLATPAGAGEDRLALGLGEGPLRVSLDDVQPAATPERHDACAGGSRADENLRRLHQPASSGWTLATSQRPPILWSKRSSMLKASLRFTGSVTPSVTRPSQ